MKFNSRDIGFFTPETIIGTVAIFLSSLFIRASAFKNATLNATGFFLLAFTSLGYLTEITRDDPNYKSITLFAAIYLYYIVGYSFSSVLLNKERINKFYFSICFIYILWYLSLFVFYLNGQLGFYSELEGATNTSRLEFGSGYTATEIVMWVGLHVPILAYLAISQKPGMLKALAAVISLLAIILLLATMSAAAIISGVVVLIIVNHYSNRSLLSNKSKYFYSLIIAIVVLLFLLLFVAGGGLVESVQTKLSNYFQGQGTRALVYLDLINRLNENPLGLGFQKYIHNNNLFWTGEGVAPHHNLLGIGVELGIHIMLLYMLTIFIFFYTAFKKLFYFRFHADIPVTGLLAASVSVVLYHQLRGFFHDTWTLKEMYLWMGIASGLAQIKMRNNCYIDTSVK